MCHMPTFMLDFPLDASLPMPLSRINMPESALPLSVFVASPEAALPLSVFRTLYPSDASAVAGSKPAVAGSKPSSASSAVAGVTYAGIEADLLTEPQWHAMLRISGEIMSFTPSD